MMTKTNQPQMVRCKTRANYPKLCWRKKLPIYRNYYICTTITFLTTGLPKKLFKQGCHKHNIFGKQPIKGQ